MQTKTQLQQMLTAFGTQATNAAWSMTWRWLCEGKATTGGGSLKSHAANMQKKCVYCGDKAELLDHFRPLVAVNGMPTGFAATPWNLVPACQLCNSSKKNRPWAKFMSCVTGKAPLARIRGAQKPSAAAAAAAAAHARRVARLRAFDAKGMRHLQSWMNPAYRKALQAIRVELKNALLAHARRVQELATATTSGATKPKKSSVLFGLQRRSGRGRKPRN
jgi:hypothetical protein